MPESRFHDGRHGATYVVRVFVFGRELRIVGADDATLAVWRISDMAAAPEIDPDGMVALTERTQPGVLLIDNPEELDTLRRAGVKLPGHRAGTRGHLIVIAALIGAVGIGFLTVTVLPRWLASVMPFAWEQTLGAPAERLVTASARRCTGEIGQAALDRLIRRLLVAGGVDIPVTIVVLDDPLRNAFTLPGGRVLLMRGLIEDATDGPMLAGVIAHELGHVAHRDPVTMLIRAMGFSILLHATGFGDAGGFAASSAGSLMNLSYDRAAETAADDAAIESLTKAGLRADGLSRFFARMQAHTGTAEAPASKPKESGGAGLEWFATHPSNEERRQRTARPETGELPFTEAEWQAIRTMCAR